MLSMRCCARAEGGPEYWFWLQTPLPLNRPPFWPPFFRNGMAGVAAWLSHAVVKSESKLNKHVVNNEKRTCISNLKLRQTQNWRTQNEVKWFIALVLARLGIDNKTGVFYLGSIYLHDTFRFLNPLPSFKQYLINKGHLWEKLKYDKVCVWLD